MFCNAIDKLKQTLCNAAAVDGKSKCRRHGGLSTGPRTTEGKARIAAAKTVHGRETSTLRQLRSQISYELRRIESEMFAEGLIHGPRTRGRKPTLWAQKKGLTEFSARVGATQSTGASLSVVV
jgi:hypothetical protein